jgi:hypothetical protein
LIAIACGARYGFQAVIAFMSRIMKVIVSSLLAIFLAVGNAQAVCNRAALAGSWTFMSTNGSDYCVASFGSTGATKVPCKGGSSAWSQPAGYYMTVTPTLTSACLLGGTVLVNGITYAIAGRAEQVTGTLVPNTMTLRMVYKSSTWGSGWIAYRN